MTTDDQQMPWEKSGEEFDAEKAKTLILGLNRTIDNLKARNKDLLSAKKSAGEGSDELKSENLKLKIQLHTGLNDKQVARLNGDTFDEMLEDADSYAAETGIELRSFFESEQSPTGTPGNDQGGEGEGYEDGEREPVGRDFRPPTRKHGQTSGQSVDLSALAKEIDFGF